MKVSRWVMLAAVALLAVGLAAGGALVRSDSGNAAANATVKANAAGNLYAHHQSPTSHTAVEWNT